MTPPTPQQLRRIRHAHRIVRALETAAGVKAYETWRDQQCEHVFADGRTPACR